MTARWTGSGSILGRLAAFGLVAGMVLGAGEGFAQAPPKERAPDAPAETVQPKPAAPVDPVFDAASKAFDALPEADRKAVQDALVWSGDYNGSVDGEFGRMSYEAIRSFQRRQKAAVSGILDETQRKALLQAADKARSAAKFAVITDATGLRIGIPRALAPHTGKAGQGTKYHADKDAFLIETLVVPASGPTLEQMFDTARQPGEDRKVSYRLMRPDFFIVAGEEKGRRFYLRVAKGEKGLRGFRLSYAAARAREFDRVSIAIANSFEPFPRLGAPADRPNAPAPVPLPPARPPEKVLSVVATALVVGPGMVLTAAALPKVCEDPRIGDRPLKPVGADAGAGLMLAEAPGARGTPWTRPPRGDAIEAAEILVAPVAAEPGVPPGFAAGVAVTAADRALWRLEAALQGGALGAPIFDRQGALVGVVVEGRRAPFRVAGVVPASAYTVASAQTLALFMQDRRLTPSGTARVADQPQSAGAVAAAILPSVVAVTCLK